MCRSSLDKVALISEERPTPWKIGLAIAMDILVFDGGKCGMYECVGCLVELTFLVSELYEC